MKKVLLLILLVMGVFLSCTHDPEERVAPAEPREPGGQASAVVFDLDAVPYGTLSTYNFFRAPMVSLEPVQGVLPYEVITPLFSDYAHKKRFIWMPTGTGARYTNDASILDFPDGAVLIKNFYYDRVLPADERRIIETRLLYKKNGNWFSADYVWNATQTEAYLDMNGSITPVEWVNENGSTRQVNYRIPAAAECQTCHKISGVTTPIGPKPQNLNMDLAYADGVSNQLAKWASVGYLDGGYPSSIATTVRWDDPAQPLTDRVRAYVDMNCAHCHDDGRHCDYRPMRFAWNENSDLVNLGVCVPPEDQIDPAYTYIVAASNPNRSMLFHRITSTAEDVRMPLLGRTLVHEEAVDLIEAWINSISPPCQ